MMLVCLFFGHLRSKISTDGFLLLLINSVKSRGSFTDKLLNLQKYFLNYLIMLWT